MRRAMFITSRASSGLIARPRILIFAVAQPFLDDLVSADVIFPDVPRDVAPVGHVVQKHIERIFAQKSAGIFGGNAPRGRFGVEGLRFRRVILPLAQFSASRHDNALFAEMAPTGGYCQMVVSSPNLPPPNLEGTAIDLNRGPILPLVIPATSASMSKRDAICSPNFAENFERILIQWQWDARPIAPDTIGIFSQIGCAVTNGQSVHPN